MQEKNQPIYCVEDLVNYWRVNSSDYNGPATIIAKDRQHVLIKHGGSFVRAHPHQLQHYQAKPNSTHDKEVTDAQNLNIDNISENLLDW